MNKYKITKIKNEECKEWFLHKHYAKRLPSVSYAFGLYENNSLEGVCSFGKPMSHTLIKGAFKGLYQDCFFELNRLVVNEKLKKNSLSFFIAQCFKQLPKPSVLVSYADTSQNHHGYIYQATNWIYTGLSNKFTDYAVEGLEHMHHSSIEDSVGRYDKNKNIDKHTLLKEKYGDKLYLKERPRKHRYFYLIGTKKQKKEMLANLAYKVCNYPKGDNKRYKADYKPASQGLLFV